MKFRRGADVQDVAVPQDLSMSQDPPHSARANHVGRSPAPAPQPAVDEGVPRLLPPEPPPSPAPPVSPPLWSLVPAEPTAEPFRFSLLELLAVTAMAAVLLGILRLVGAALFAAVAGVAAFICLVLLSLYKPDRAILQVAWWVLVGIYLLAALAAIMRVTF